MAKTIINFNKRQAITFPFGTIYIEALYYDHHNPYEREEEDRIKIYDSKDKLMDYYSMEFFEGYAKMDEVPIEKVYTDFINSIANIKSVKDLVSDMNDGVEKISKDWQVIGKLIDCRTKEEVEEHEWVNIIGEYYVLFFEA